MPNHVVDTVISMLSCKEKVAGYDQYTCSNPNCLHTKVIAFTCKSRLCNSCGKKPLSNGSLSKMKSYPNAIINISLTPCPQRFGHFSKPIVSY
ncbi:transposase zinc-binding domain-containing protein [Piscirickettsia salmonis]|uniref:transposase zinc-binding domain-containing protein n=1 Tax=Piscirickettsia salmonis TaxID=1238 RepID=UPI0034D175EE